MPATDEDVHAVTLMLGRPPRADFDVVVRRANGTPVVIRNAPLLADGTPMPTRYWLVDPDLTRRVSTLESRGGCREAEASVEAEAVARTHRAYAAERDAALPSGHAGPRPSGGVGGTARGVEHELEHGE
jgi:hypothetical protein